MSRKGFGEIVPAQVISFLKEFATSIESGDLQAIMENYLTRWEEINKNYHRTTSWPRAETIQSHLQLKGEFKDLFLCLYKQLYFRHIFQRLEPSEEDPHRFLEEYIDSFQNFVDLFNILISIWRKQDGDLRSFDMPNVWLWDIIHSFVSQCQSFHLWKCKFDHPDTPELNQQQTNLLWENKDKAWHLCAVFRYLSIFAWYANIPVRLGLPPQYSSKGTSDMQEVLGQYSVIGMLRLHTIMGDYTTALEVLESIELRTNNAVTSFWSCDLTICYHMAVCYLMKGRFQDVLSIVPEVRAKYGTLFEQDNPLSNRLQSWFERLKKMEIICKFMCWSQEASVLALEEYSVHASSKDWVLEMWDNSHPDFISPKPPTLEGSNENYVAKAQYAAFDLLVNPRFNLENVRQSMAVYRSADLETLGADIGDENYKKLLLRYKLATRQVQKQIDSLPHEGKSMCACDQDFFIKDNFLESREIQPDVSYAEDLSKLILNVSRFGRTLD